MMTIFARKSAPARQQLEAEILGVAIRRAQQPGEYLRLGGRN